MASPPARVLKKVQEGLEHGWPVGLTVLTGGDLYHLDRAQRAILARLVESDASDFGLTVYADDKLDVSHVVSACRSVGMFASRRVVLVRDIGILEGEPDVLTEYAKKPPRDSYLIVRAPVLDRRRKLHKSILKLGHVYEFALARNVDRGRMLSDVQGVAADKQMKLERDAAVFLAQVCGGDLYRISSELDKLAAAPDSRGARVTLAQARDVAASGGLLTGWELANALEVRDGPAALAAARRLVDAGDEPIRIVGGLAYRMRGLLRAKAMNQADSSYSLMELLRFPSLLLEADRTLKSRSIAPGAVLETLVRRMIARASEEEASA